MWFGPESPHSYNSIHSQPSIPPQANLGEKKVEENTTNKGAITINPLLLQHKIKAESMDTLSWPHQDESIGIVNPSFLTTTTTTPSTTTTAARQVVERKVRPQKERALHCPRCNSTNTKFCYYNNYSLTQPRYFCKTCRRYWTEGGSLRNVPVGGGSRKNKRPFSSNTSTITTTATAPPPPPPPPPPLQDPLRDTQNPTFATTGRQGSFCGLLGNTAEDTPTWPSGIDLLARCPFVQAPMMEAAGGGGGGQLGLQGLRAAGLDLGVDGGGSYDCMQPAAGLGLVLPFQEMGKASAGDLVMGIHGGGGGGDAAASAGGVWNW